MNRLYARVRNYGAAPATDVVVHFDITDPPGLGINGSNGFKLLGTVDKTSFPGLALIQPGQSVDVYLEWTPNFALTPAQIQQGRFFFHTCVRVRLDHVASETFFANQDGDGQQENIDYFQAGSPGSPGAPGAPNDTVIHLRNDSPAVSKEFYLTVLREQLPPTWTVTVNNGNPILQLGPNQVVDVLVTIKQTAPEPVGSHHSIRVLASSHATLRNAQRPNDVHDEFKPLGGVQLQVAVLRKPKLQCKSLGDGRVEGRLTGAGSEDKKRLNVLVVGVDGQNRFIARTGTVAYVQGPNGVFQARFPSKPPKRAVCLFAGTTEAASAGSTIFPM